MDRIVPAEIIGPRNDRLAETGQCKPAPLVAFVTVMMATDRGEVQLPSSQLSRGLRADDVFRLQYRKPGYDARVQTQVIQQPDQLQL